MITVQIELIDGLTTIKRFKDEQIQCLPSIGQSFAIEHEGQQYSGEVLFINHLLVSGDRHLISIDIEADKQTKECVLKTLASAKA